MDCWKKIAAILGFLGVLLGAAGAHWLSPYWADAKSLEWWEKGVFYHLIHAVLLYGVAVSASGKRARVSAFFLFLGILLFSGSLYVMSLTGIRVLGAITPLGGLSFLVGWAMLISAPRASAEVGQSPP